MEIQERRSNWNKMLLVQTKKPRLYVARACHSTKGAHYVLQPRNESTELIIIFIAITTNELQWKGIKTDEFWPYSHRVQYAGILPKAPKTDRTVGKRPQNTHTHSPSTK